MNRRTLLAMSFFGALSAVFGPRARATGSEPTISPVNPAMQADIDAHAQLGQDFVEQYLGKKKQYTGVEIDAAIERWRASSSQSKPAADLVTERLGALFGAYLIDKLQLEWAIYSDARGEDLCVAHRKLSVVGFPHSSVFKAVSQGREEALPLVELALTKQISEADRSREVKPR